LRRFLFGLPVLLFAVLAGYFLVGLGRDPSVLPSALIDRPAPAFDLPGPGPRAGLATADLPGRVTLVNFFASWCVPCRKEMPAFERVHRRLGSRVAFLGINHQDQQEPALQLLRETGVSYPAGYDPAGKAALAYGLFGMPTTVFISPDGRILKRRTGEMSESELETAIQQLLVS